MDKIIRLDKFDVSSADPQAGKLWRLWYRNFTYYLTTIASLNPDKLEVLYLNIGATVADVIEGCSGFEHAIQLLKSVYDKIPSVIHARHLLSTRLQQENESLDQYLQALNRLAADCCFKDVTATTYRDESVRDAFIRGLRSSVIRARLLENDTLNLQEATQCARALEQAHFRAESYASQIESTAAVTTKTKNVLSDSTGSRMESDSVQLCTALPACGRCYNCGGKRHINDDRRHCPARNKVCRNCGKLGHFSKVCRSTMPFSRSTFAIIIARAKDDKRSPPITKVVELKGKRLTALIDTGSSDNFISTRIVNTMDLSTSKRNSVISMASSAISLKLTEYCTKNIIFNGYEYKQIDFTVLPDSCMDIILGVPFLKLHQSITISFGGPQDILNICALTKISCAPVKLFRNLTPDCKPIATKPRNYRAEDARFIEKEILQLLEDDIIEISYSPWRAQIVVTSPPNKKKRLVVDFHLT